MVGYAGVVALVYLAFFKTKYKRLLAEQNDPSNVPEVSPAPFEAPAEQVYTPGRSSEPRAPILENEDPPDTNSKIQLAKF